MKTHWKRLINPEYIGAYSLPESGEMKVKIKTVAKAQVTGTGGKVDECTVAQLENNKPFILNRTNCKMISKLSNSPFIEDWNGLEITIYAATTKVAGEVVECLRIKPTLPKKSELVPNNKTWDDAKLAIKNKSVTIAQIKTKYILSDKNEKLLTDEAV